MAQPFSRPPVEAGMTVQWKQSPDSAEPWAAAVVTAVGDQALDLAVLPPGHFGVYHKGAVRHKDDPQLGKQVRNEAGCWRHVPMVEALLKLASEFGDRVNEA